MARTRTLLLQRVKHAEQARVAKRQTRLENRNRDPFEACVFGRRLPRTSDRNHGFPALVNKSIAIVSGGSGLADVIRRRAFRRDHDG